jgi:hypothetical protein
MDGIEFFPVTWYRAGESPHRVLIRLRLRGSDRLDLHQRPMDFRPGGERVRERWDFFNSRAFHDLLSRVFTVPFTSANDYLVDGYDTVHEGVTVFHGKVIPNAPTGPAPSWNEMRLLVTDSDPQYFCVGLTFPVDSEDRKEGPAP